MKNRMALVSRVFNFLRTGDELLLLLDGKGIIQEVITAFPDTLGWSNVDFYKGIRNRRITELYDCGSRADLRDKALAVKTDSGEITQTELFVLRCSYLSKNVF